MRSPRVRAIMLHAALDRREHAQPEQVDLQEAGIRAGVLVPLHHLPALHRRRHDRAAVDQRARGDDHPAGVLGEVARQPVGLARPGAPASASAPTPRCARAPAARAPPARRDVVLGHAPVASRRRARHARSRPRAGRAPCPARGSPRASGRSGRPPPAPRARGRSARARAGSAPRGCRAGSRGRCRAARSAPRAGSARAPARWRSGRCARGRSGSRRSRRPTSRARDRAPAARAPSRGPRTSAATSRASSSISWCSRKKPARPSFSITRSSCSRRAPASSPAPRATPARRPVALLRALRGRARPGAAASPRPRRRDSGSRGPCVRSKRSSLGQRAASRGPPRGGRRSGWPSPAASSSRGCGCRAAAARRRRAWCDGAAPRRRPAARARARACACTSPVATHAHAQPPGERGCSARLRARSWRRVGALQLDAQALRRRRRRAAAARGSARRGPPITALGAAGQADEALGMVEHRLQRHRRLAALTPRGPRACGRGRA